MIETGGSFADVAQDVAQSTVFTTHTPVDAGHDRFPPELVDEYLEPLRLSLRLSRDEFLGLGRVRPEDPTESLCMTVLAFKRTTISILRATWCKAWMCGSIRRAGRKISSLVLTCVAADHAWCYDWPNAFTWRTVACVRDACLGGLAFPGERCHWRSSDTGVAPLARGAGRGAVCGRLCHIHAHAASSRANACDTSAGYDAVCGIHSACGRGTSTSGAPALGACPGRACSAGFRYPIFHPIFYPILGDTVFTHAIPIAASAASWDASSWV